MAWQIGVDVGGTFTDLPALDRRENPAAAPFPPPANSDGYRRRCPVESR